MYYAGDGEKYCTKKPRDTNYFVPPLKYPSPFFMNFSSVVMNSSKHFKRTQCKINDEIQCAW